MRILSTSKDCERKQDGKDWGNNHAQMPVRPWHLGMKLATDLSLERQATEKAEAALAGDS